MLHVDLDTGQPDFFNGGGGHSVEEVGNDWYRVWFSHTIVGSGGLGTIYWTSSNDSSYPVSFTGDGSSGVLVWGAQFEEGSFPTSLIPTTGASATRSADIVNVTNTNFSRFFKDTEGTFAIDIQMPKGWVGVSGWPYFLQASNGSSHRINLYGRPSENYLSGHIQSGSEVDVNLSTNSTIALDSGEISRHAIAYKEDDGRYSGDGDVFTVTDTSVTLPLNINRLDIGQHYSGALQMSGWFRRLRYYNKRQPNTKLQKLTDTSFLLDKFKGAKAAHSLRSLRGGRDNTPVARVRRDYDSYEADYTANQVSNGDLEADFQSEKQTTLPLDVSCDASELVSNGDFTSNATGWTAYDSATISSENGMLKVANGSSNHGRAAQEVKVKIGKTYKVTGDVLFTVGDAVDLQFKLGTSNGGSEYYSSGDLTANTLISQTIVATGTSLYVTLQNSGNASTNGYFDNISVKEVNPIATGFSTRKINSSYTGKAMRCRNQGNVEVEVGFDDNDEISLSSPVTNTSQNLLGYSEDFGEWGYHSTYTPTLQKGIADPFGGSNAGLLTAGGSNNASQIKNENLSLTNDTYYTASMYIKEGTSTKTRYGLYQSAWVSWVETTWTGGVPSTTANLSAFNITYEKIGDDGWYRMSYNSKATATASDWSLIFYPDRNATNKNTYIFGAQLEETLYESTGTEKITNGVFTEDRAEWWDADNNSFTPGWWHITNPDASSVSNGRAILDSSTGTADARQQVPVTPGKQYTISVTMSEDSGGNGKFYMSDGANYSYAFGSWNATTTETTFSKTVIPTQSVIRLYPYAPSSSGKAYYSDISVKEHDPIVSEYAQAPVVSDDGSSTTATTLGEFAGKENLITQSENIEGNFGPHDGSKSGVIANSAVAPDGTNTADKIYAKQNGTNIGVFKNFGSTLDAGVYSFSVYLKAGEFTTAYFNSGAGSAWGQIWFNLSNGTVGSTGGGVWSDGAMSDEGDGWWRCSATRSLSGTSDYLYVLQANSDNTTSATANGTDGLYVWGLQLNTNSLKTYQATSSTALTGDVNLVNWYDQNQGEDFVQSTAADQPRIVMGSELVTDSGGKASVYFDSSDLLNNKSLSGQQRLDGYFVTDTTDTDYLLFADDTGASRYAYLSEDGDTSNPAIDADYGGDTVNVYVNGTAVSGTSRDVLYEASKGHSLITTDNATTATWGDAYIGSRVSGRAFTGKISEMVFFPNMDSSTKRFPIEQNMIQHFMDGAIYSEDFNADTGGWTDTEAGGSSTTLSHETTNPISGSGSLKIALSNTGTSGGYPRVRGYMGTDVKIGVKYRLSFKAKLLSGSPECDIRFGTATTNMYFATNQTFTTTAQTYTFTETFDTLAGGSLDAIDFLFDGTKGPFELLIDDVKVEELGVQGYVTKLYDQTGNNCHATQDTASYQPKLVAGGDLITSGGKPAWEYVDGSNDLVVQGMTGITDLDAWFVHDTSSTEFMYPTSSSSSYYGLVAKDGDSSTTLASNYGPTLEVNGTLSSVTDRDDVHDALTGRKLVYHRSAITVSWPSFQVGFFGNSAVSGWNYTGKFSEWIWYDSDQHANQSGIESNINSHYNIY